MAADKALYPSFLEIAFTTALLIDCLQADSDLETKYQGQIQKVLLCKGYIDVYRVPILHEI